MWQSTQIYNSRELSISDSLLPLSSLSAWCSLHPSLPLFPLCSHPIPPPPNNNSVLPFKLPHSIRLFSVLEMSPDPGAGLLNCRGGIGLSVLCRWMNRVGGGWVCGVDGGVCSWMGKSHSLIFALTCKVELTQHQAPKGCCCCCEWPEAFNAAGRIRIHHSSPSGYLTGALREGSGQQQFLPVRGSFLAIQF